jgi:hypothetical protein
VEPGPTLPNLADYRRDLVAQGAPHPLPLVPWRREGLLAALPAPPAGRRGWPWDVQTPPFVDDPDAWPVITVVTPSYQQGEFLEETIRSVLLQNYPRLEFLVLDGGSTDASAAIIERYRPWVSFGRVARDRGQGHAINLGFSLASGELRGWLNSDDFHLPGALQRITLAARTAAADIYYGDGLDLDAGSGRLSLAPAPLAHGRYVRFPGLLLSHATFWRAACHQPIWEEQQCALDYELWIRLLPAAKLRHLATPLAVFRQHAAAKSFAAAGQRRWAEDAARNGRAHPALYRNRPWLDREYRVVQRLVRAWRGRAAPRRLAAICAECGWPSPGDASS